MRCGRQAFKCSSGASACERGETTAGGRAGGTEIRPQQCSALPGARPRPRPAVTAGGRSSTTSVWQGQRWLSMVPVLYRLCSAVPVLPSVWKYFPCVEGKSDARHPPVRPSWRLVPGWDGRGAAARACWRRCGGSFDACGLGGAGAGVGREPCGALKKSYKRAYAARQRCKRPQSSLLPPGRGRPPPQVSSCDRSLTSLLITVLQLGLGSALLRLPGRELPTPLAGVRNWKRSKT